jgi:hypothetical protein
MYEQTIFKAGFLFGYMFLWFLMAFVYILFYGMKLERYNKFLTITKNQDKFKTWENSTYKWFK